MMVAAAVEAYREEEEESKLIYNGHRRKQIYLRLKKIWEKTKRGLIDVDEG